MKTLREEILQALHKRMRNVNMNEVHDSNRTVGERVSDAVVAGMGSWTFVITQTIIVAFWICANVWWLVHPFDPYPLILLNLVFSTQAAYASPLIMMSQNRQASKDRLMAENDYHVNVKAQADILRVLDHLDRQDEVILSIDKRLDAAQK